MEILQAVTWIRRALKDKTAVPPETLRAALHAVADQIPPLIAEHRSLKSKHLKAITQRAKIHARLRKMVREGGGADQQS